MAKYNRICLHKSVLIIENMHNHGFLGSYKNRGCTNRLLKYTQISIIGGVKTIRFTNKRAWYRPRHK